MGTRVRNNPDHLFELFCEIAIPSNSNGATQVTWKFPYAFKDEETLKCLPQFAFPADFIDNAVHHFSFVFTNIDSKWTFGFCRHAPTYPSCFVILSYLPWHETFYRILNHAAELSNKQQPSESVQLQCFLEATYKVQVPDPGVELIINYQNKNFNVTCPDHNKLPSIPENRNMTEYFNAIDAANMMTIFASMLHERRILVLSKKLSRLSACVQAANALIYPMHWQHIFIPVLPKHLVDYLSAPMPFLIGIPASTFSRMKSSDIGDVVLLDADNNRVESPYADLDALPSEVLQSLRHDLKNPQEMLGDSVARAFLRASVKLIGGYWNALKLKPGEKISFNPEMFVQTRPAPMQPFLEKILQLQIFQQFIESRLRMLNSGQGVCDEFEFELTAHEDKASTRLRNQYRDWVSYMKKEGGAFFKNMKKQVQATGKKAYKDIRSMIHEMHHHKIMEEASSPSGRKRVSSVPSILANNLNLELKQKGNRNTSYNKSSSSKELSLTAKELSNNQTTLDTVTNKCSQESFEDSLLTFQPIDMDLMGDLEEYLYRSCTLCDETFQKDKSASDPQLIDFKSVDKCTSCSSRHSSKENEVSADDVPPPLLPRPPSSKSPLKPPFRSPPVPNDKPLIQLDDINNSNDNVFYTPNAKNNGNISTNPFVKDIRPSTNPFHRDTGYTNSSCATGPNVRNMVNHWQDSTTVLSNFTPNRRSELSSTAPIIPYRSQPFLSRTASTPPMSQLPSSASGNPFLSNGVTSSVTKKSWENFQ